MTTARNGSLILLSAGKDIIMLNDQPFALIQSRKSEMVKQGYKKSDLRIKYKQQHCLAMKTEIERLINYYQDANIVLQNRIDFQYLDFWSLDLVKQELKLNKIFIKQLQEIL